MINLLQEKLEEVENLRNYTKQILMLSTKKDFDRISSMIVSRQGYEEILNLIDGKIEELKSTENYCEDSMIIRGIKEDIKVAVKQIIEMDKEIRKRINVELKGIKEDLNQPEKTLKLNLKA